MSEPSARRWIVTTLIVGLALLLAGGYAIGRRLPVRYVRIEGALQRVDLSALQHALEPLTMRGYLAADLNAIEAAVRQQAWVATASVQRQWPDILIVQVQEQLPYARWGGGGLVNSNGERFDAPLSADLAYLPLVRGPDGQEKVLLAMLKTMNVKLAALGHRIETLELSPRRAWSLRLDGGLTVAMGHQDALAAFERFLTLVGLLGNERLQAVQSVDMRYPNGFAVSMKPATEMPPDATAVDPRTGVMNKPKV